MLYFAYGSNMDPVQMRERCPSSRFVTVAVLPDHELGFPRRSRIRNCGVAGVAFAPRRTVWGVIYSIPNARDIRRLDRREGYAPGRRVVAYRREPAHVLAGGNRLKPLSAFTYMPVRQIVPPLPSEQYLSHMIRGAEHWGLPAWYVENLRNQETGDGQKGTE
jgi:hypothetical protein